MVYLFDHNQQFWHRQKVWLKRLLGKDVRGPEAVEQSLCAGLDALDCPYSINSPVGIHIPTAGVLSGVETLRWVIAQKSRGLVKTIVAGPNLVVSPQDFGGILKHPSIDVVITPSQWVKDFYISQAPVLKDKIAVWPAGVAVPNQSQAPSQRDLDFLVYRKTAHSQIFGSVIDELQRLKSRFAVLRYGKFRQREYFQLLNRARFMIYLSDSESQGLAMFEAWARDVPTLVWDRGFWQKDRQTWQGLTSSPYLDPKAGLRFKDAVEFRAGLADLNARQFFPRDYVVKNFTNRICAERYLKIYYSFQ